METWLRLYTTVEEKNIWDYAHAVRNIKVTSALQYDNALQLLSLLDSTG